MTFTQKLLTVQLVLGTIEAGAPAAPFHGPNGQVGNTLTLEGLRVWAQIDQQGPRAGAKAQITIFGMTFSQMMAANTFSAWPNVQNDAQVLLYAGDASGKSLVFSGTIIDAIADFNAQPDTAFHITAVCSMGAQMTPLPPTSVEGSVNAAALLQALASQCNPPLSFENNSNVNVQLSNPHFDGSAMDQIRAIVSAAQINYSLINGTLAIWPKGQSRQVGEGRGQGITLTPQTGLVGYPTFGRGRIGVKVEFNPAIQYGMNITIAGSQITPANGTYSLNVIKYSLQSMTPNGEWFMDLAMWPQASDTSN